MSDFELKCKILAFEIKDSKYLGDSIKTPFLKVETSDGVIRHLRVPACYDNHDFKFWCLQYRGFYILATVWFSSFHSRVGTGELTTLCHKIKPQLIPFSDLSNDS